MLFIQKTLGYWDLGTTTEQPPYYEDTPRQSFFRWQKTEFDSLQFWYPYFDWEGLRYRRLLNCVAGISIDFLPLSTALILNRRILISSANWVEPYLNRQRDLRIWALGRAGEHITPYRYRVWRVQRLFPRSLNPEHMHGPRGHHVPRHDITIIHSLDQLYIFRTMPTRYHYAYRAFLCDKHWKLAGGVWFAGSGFEDLEHIYENYKIFYSTSQKTDIVDCSIYLPKWWGKFICLKNIHGHSGVQNGGGFFSSTYLVGLGCFEIRYNEDRILVFTDLRYYMDHIYHSAYIEPGEYYEYAYPQWGITLGYFSDGGGNTPYIPSWQIMDDLYPYGKK
ncbi:uncharacterized protein LOC115441949 [Manduca sexta]|uniref:uncharacterized protein LOC115441949 n=1 Tax=Manduca sexta TaxID=7130 RepID=UPI00188F8548|nr:uncharacterized protein LOC115441949 [Manduca sexta]